MLKNDELAGKKVGTAYGEIEFNDKGESNDLTVEQQKELGGLPGFEYVAKAEPKKPETKKVEDKKPAPRSQAKSTDNKPEDKK